MTYQFKIIDENDKLSSFFSLIQKYYTIYYYDYNIIENYNHYRDYNIIENYNHYHDYDIIEILSRSKKCVQ